MLHTHHQTKDTQAALKIMAVSIVGSKNMLVRKALICRASNNAWISSQAQYALKQHCKGVPGNQIAQEAERL